MKDFLSSPLFGSLLTLGGIAIGSLLRNARAGAAENTKVSELERRVAALETNTVSRSDYEALTKRLDEIREDLREIRKQVSHPST